MSDADSANNNGVEADSAARDFAATPLPPPSSPLDPGDATGSRTNEDTRSHYALNIEPGLADTANTGSVPDPTGQTRGRSDTLAPMSPSIRRRTGRTGTFKTVDDFQDFEVGPGWHPGAEPGVDPSKPDGGHASMPTLSAPCDITVVDFSEDRFSMQKLDNETLNGFMNRPQPTWVKCRWVNVNGLSWDVIQSLGRHKKLHKLAIEDMMNTRNRTKVEWYPTHAFMVLTLQKLVHLYELDSDASSDSDDDDDGVSLTSGPSKRSGRFPRKLVRKLTRVFRGGIRGDGPKDLGSGKQSGTAELGGYLRSQASGFSDVPDISQLRTLQMYHASPDDSRAQFMEKNSALASRDLAVACEQVSMFITNDNTIISFFELSARDVETPIIRRLQTSDTIIRQSCDASMVCQAIIDAIIDLAIPVTACYGDVIGDLELDVLTGPDLDRTKKLYIFITEINKLLAFINPIIALINALRDHQTDVSQELAMATLLDPNHEPIITRLTYTYLGDVLDHCVLMTETLNQLKSSADGMIGLIFNTISAHQNESMKQLTIATIIFLPLTFLTGYFGQNFQPFTVLYEDIGYFWKIAIPVVTATALILLREVIYDYCKTLLQRRYIWRLRKRRSRRRDKKRR
ncbi:Magnesium and cobalt transporter CorA [Madurella fahalii]|uniref:Magnesium and cobalt transporter CorA n=1 Tax=Madurella fahalii TaxID=1157608 RepID=A0ABQ0GT05_9PEZI